MAAKTLLWDIDGVLIWHHPSDPSLDWRASLSATALAAWESFQRTDGWQICLRDEDADTRGLFERYAVDHGHDVVDDAQRIVDTWLQGNIQVATEALTRLKAFQDEGISCGIATNQDGVRKPYIESWLEEHGLAGLPLFMSCSLKSAKPDEAYFSHIEKELGCAPDDLVLIDDTKANVDGALAAGWGAVHVDDTYRLNPLKWNDFKLLPD